MSPLKPWFDRKFAFDFPASLYPCLLTRLRGTAARLEEEVAPLNPTGLARRSAQDWSIQENAGHLLDLEPLWSARVEDFLCNREHLTPADLTNKKTHEAAHNTRPLQEILDGFRHARQIWVHRIEELEKDDFERTSLHPRLETSMRLVDLLYFVAEHDDHHLAQIWDLKRMR